MVEYAVAELAAEEPAVEAVVVASFAFVPVVVEPVVVVVESARIAVGAAFDQADQAVAAE